MSYNESGDWERLLARLRQTCNQHRERGLVIVRCNLVIVNGELKCWETPVVTTFEPHRAGGEVVDYLTGEHTT